MTKWFQTICRLEASHCTMAQATTYEMVLSRYLVCSAAYTVAATTQQAKEWKSTLHRLHKEANKAWKDTNNVIFSHLLKYDSELANFLNSAEDDLRTNSCCTTMPGPPISCPISWHTCMVEAGSNESSPSRVASPASSGAHHLPASSCPRTPFLRTSIVRSCSNSASSPGS